MASKQLKPSAVVGFNGWVRNGLQCGSDGTRWVRASGSTIIYGGIKKSAGSKLSFLRGHTNTVTCLALSNSGRLLASGQVTTISGLARIVIWDLATGTELRHMEMHQGKVQDLNFSMDDTQLASIGGEDDSRLALWDVATGKALTGTSAASDFLYAVRFLSGTTEGLATAGNFNLTLWGFDGTHKLVPHAIHTGQLRRSFTSIIIDPSDKFMYCATSSGDVVQVDVQKKIMVACSPNGKAIGFGITALAFASGSQLLAGTADGSVHVMQAASATGQSGSTAASFSILASKKLGPGSITNIVANPSSSKGSQFLCGLTSGSIFQITVDLKAHTVTSEVLSTAHAGRAAGVVFPHDYAKVFATCGHDGVRVWETDSFTELLNIHLANLECTSIVFSQDGKTILTGWSDGNIRAFGPESGKEKFTIHDAHHGPVSALAGTDDSRRIISGGGSDGNVRVWDASTRALLADMVEHQAGVNCVSVRDSATRGRPECVSAGADGSCIVWDLTTYRRRTTLLANTSFKAVVYHPDGSQLVTVGTDRQISYWDAFNGQAIRIIQGSNEQLSWLATDSKGNILVTADHNLRVWHYDQGTCNAIGSGHGATVTGIAIAPDASRMVSVDNAGAIMVWPMPSIT